MTERPGPRTLVLDTSVAVKFYLPEDLRDEALSILASVEAGETRLLAPGTIQPEFFNAMWQQHRRGDLSFDEVSEFWSEFADTTIDLYAPESLMSRAVEITSSTGAIIYDALFLALAEYTSSIVVTADDKLLKTLEGTPFAEHARYLGRVRDLL